MTFPTTPDRADKNARVTAGRFGLCCLLVSCLLISSIAVAGAGTQEKPRPVERAREAGKAFVKDMKSLGRDLKNSEAGQRAMQLGREVRQVTRAAWKETLEARKQTLRELRKQNKELRRRLELREDSREDAR